VGAGQVSTPVQHWAVLVLAVATWALPALGGDTAPPARSVAAPVGDEPPSAYLSKNVDPGSARRAQSGSITPVTPSPGPSAAPEPAPANLLAVVRGTGSTTAVTTSEELAGAISSAKPGDTIRMAAGTYSPVVITSAGTTAAPITLTGPADAVITGSGKDYTVHLDGASYWQLVGFGVTGGGKGVMLDNTQHTLLDSLDVGRTGDEAVHFRTNSSDNTVQRSTIHDTGLQQPEYGEGVYVGSAKSNWKKITGGRPDLSMRNRIVGNTFRTITAENVDVKEETAGTLITGNRFDGSATSGENYADSIVDVKGYDTTVTDNVTTGDSAALTNIIETHVITDKATSGCGNTIEGNTTDGFTPKGALLSVDKKCS
jgi:hypothetical protein